MERPTLYVAITNHGFGHATRTASVAATIQKLCPDVLLVMVTTAPRWLLDCYIEGDFIQRPRALDLGVVQADSLQMDKDATLEKLLEIEKNKNSIIASEVNFIRQNKVHLVLADVPFLALKLPKPQVYLAGLSVTSDGTLFTEIGGEALSKLLIG